MADFQLNAQDVLRVLLVQYDDSPRLRGLVSGIVGVLEVQAINPLRVLERALNPVVSEGILLDWIGARLGLPRPTVASSDAEYFGFHGTEPEGGRTFGQAPFFTTQRGIEQVEPVGDATYRTLILARARRLRGSANRETIEAVLGILFGEGNGYINETTDPMSIVVTTQDTIVWRLASDELFELLIPRPVGYQMSIAGAGTTFTHPGAVEAPPAPVGPVARHTFTITVGTGIVRGYFKQGSIGAIQGDTYNLPNGNSAEIRQVMVDSSPSNAASTNIAVSELRFQIQSAGLAAGDLDQLPTSIVCTNGSDSATFGVQTTDDNNFGGQGLSRDYIRTDGAAIDDVFVSTETVTVELYYA